jgi:hypothetical protein
VQLPGAALSFGAAVPREDIWDFIERGTTMQPVQACELELVSGGSIHIGNITVKITSITAEQINISEQSRGATQGNFITVSQ